MTSKYTQGAWNAEAFADAYKVVAVERTPGLPIVTNVAVCTGPDAAANCLLIAAAPELLSALQAAELALRERGLRACGEYKQVEAAIAKATGAA